MKKKLIRKQQIPSLFTLINLYLGFLALLAVARDDIVAGAYLIVVAGIFDMMDGKLARLFDTAGDFGKELDSLADVISFCLAPAFLIWYVYTADMHPAIGGLIAGAPLFFGAIRLARFNIDSRPSGKYFTGLPSPINAILIASAVLYYHQAGSLATGARVVLPMVMATSFLMLSRVRFLKFPLLSFRHGIWNSLSLLTILAGAVIALLFGAHLLLPFALFYVSMGLMRWLVRAESVYEVAVED